jgi:hypothetical protein
LAVKAGARLLANARGSVVWPAAGVVKAAIACTEVVTNRFALKHYLVEPAHKLRRFHFDETYPSFEITAHRRHLRCEVGSKNAPVNSFSHRGSLRSMNPAASTFASNEKTNRISRSIVASMAMYAMIALPCGRVGGRNGSA